MISNLLFLTLLISSSWTAAPSLGPCQNPFELAELIRKDIYPAWFDLTPVALREIVRDELVVVADGAGPLLKLDGDNCQALFGFRRKADGTELLESLTVIARGPKEALVPGARLLSRSVELPLSTEDLNKLQLGDTVDLSQRMPTDPRLPGMLKMLVVVLRVEKSWILDFHFTYTPDP